MQPSDSPDGRKDTRTAVDKAMCLVEIIGDNPAGIGVSELARRATMGKSTAFRLLVALERNRAIERVGTAYRLGPMLRDLAAQVRTPVHDVLRDLLTPYLAELFVATRHTVHLGVLHGTEVVYLNKLRGELAVPSPSRVGGRAPAYCTAIGKVLLAHDAAATSAVMATDLRAWTANTITEGRRIEHELLAIRREGVAYNRGEIRNGVVCVAAPVLGPHGRPVAALSITGQVGQLVPEHEANTLRRLCYRASRAMQSRRVPVGPAR